MSGAFGITVCRQLTKWNIFCDFVVQKVNKKRVFCDHFRVFQCFKNMFIKHLYKITSFGCLRDFRYSTSEIANVEEHTGKILSKVTKNRLKSVYISRLFCTVLVRTDLPLCRYRFRTDPKICSFEVTNQETN